MREYELYLVMDVDAEEDEIGALIERITQLIAVDDGETSGAVTKVESRGTRRLAYPVKKKVESQDAVLTIHTSPQALPELERFLKLQEQVLRYLIVRIEE
jgi:small subunit ribosomal protein S6